MNNEQMRGGMNMPPRNILILGVGNLLLTDDGFGVHVVNALKSHTFPDTVKLLDAGVASHQLIPVLHETDLLIVVDAVEAGDIPGSLFKFSPDDLQFTSGQMSSLHQLSLTDVLQMTELTGKRPETVIIAVQPKSVSTWSLELSDEVKAVVPKAIDLVMEELKKHGLQAE